MCKCEFANIDLNFILKNNNNEFSNLICIVSENDNFNEVKSRKADWDCEYKLLYPL